MSSLFVLASLGSLAVKYSWLLLVAAHHNEISIQMKQKLNEKNAENVMRNNCASLLSSHQNYSIQTAAEHENVFDSIEQKKKRV